jgi:glucose/arabinose dehydrogenase
MNRQFSLHFRSLFFVALVLTLRPVSIFAEPDGAELYQQHCSMCHGLTGAGIPGVFPPLAGSDFLVKEREKALRAPLAGLFGRIEVNGRAYEGGMPPVTLPDQQIAAVFRHVFSSWGNHAALPTHQEIAAQRATTKFSTFEALVAAMGSTELPAAPEGWELRVGTELSFSPVRLAAHPDGKHILILAENGDVWSCKQDGAGLQRLLEGASYLDPSLGHPSVLGMTVDRNRRLYLVSNQRNEGASPVRNEVTIFRTNAWSRDQAWNAPLPWLRTAYPWGVGPYNHGVSTIAQGPDGFLYVNSGARTDGGEAGTLANYATTGEDRLTSCMWRLNPKDEKPGIEIFARGLRNSFGFCWDADGHLLATENGPDADAPEELNVIERGRHYGFPFQFSDWTAKPYPYTPDPPADLVLTKPLCNVGPDGGGSASGLSTFEPHSSPAGIVWLGPDWPPPLNSSFLVARFGNLLKHGPDTGFDVLQMKPEFAAHRISARRIISPLARPIDLLKLPGHQLAIAEYCRGTTLAAGIGTPGRLILLTPKRSGNP